MKDYIKMAGLADSSNFILVTGLLVIPKGEENGFSIRGKGRVQRSCCKETSKPERIGNRSCKDNLLSSPPVTIIALVVRL